MTSHYKHITAQQKLSRKVSYLLIIIAVLIFVLAAITQDTWGAYSQALLSVGGVILGIAAQGWLNISSMLYDVIQEERASQTAQEQLRQLGGTAFELGIRMISPKWRLLTSAVGHGAEVRRRLDEERAPKIWYFLTTNAQGFLDKGWINEVIIPAIWRGVKIKWAYIECITEDLNGKDKTREVFLDVQHAHPSKDINKRLRSAAESITTSANELKISFENILEHILSEGRQLDPDILEIYSSSVMHPFLGFLSVFPLDQPPSGFAIVNPYRMYAGSRRWGMYLESPGEVFEQYAESMLTHFTEGISRGYLRLVWSSESIIRDKSDERTNE